MVTSVPPVSDFAVSASTLAGTSAAAETSVALRVPRAARGGESRNRSVASSEIVVALDLDPDTGQHRQHVVAAGGGDRLGDRVGEQRRWAPCRWPRGIVRQRRVLLDRHGLQA